MTSIKTHGAPVKSVSWCCDDPYGVFAAIGGYPYDGIDIRIYKLEDSYLVKKIDASHGTYVFSVDWCCSEKGNYLAVGGYPNICDNFYDTRVYKFDPSITPYTFDLVASFTHGAIVRAVSWACGCCDDPNTLLLAIGGDVAKDKASIRMLKFNTQNETLTEVSSKIHGASIRALDWCCRPDTWPLLAAGGDITPFGCDNINLGIYTVDCSSGIMSLITTTSFPGSSVYTVRWCCLGQFDQLAVGGTPQLPGNDNGINIVSYLFHPVACKLLTLKTQSAQKNIYAMDWNPSCPYVDVLSWDPIEYVNPIVKYKIYAAPYKSQEPCCENCCPCLIRCCICPCVDAQLIGEIPESNKPVFRYTRLCQDRRLTYCITAVDNQGNETPVPASISV